MLSQSTLNWRVGILLATTPLPSPPSPNRNSILLHIIFHARNGGEGRGKRHAMRERESGGTEDQTENRATPRWKSWGEISKIGF